jgi:hypothetical protein
MPEREWDQYQVKLAVASIKENVDKLPRLVIFKLNRLIFTNGTVRNLLRFPLVYLFFFGLILLLVSGNKRFVVFYMLLLYVFLSTLLFYTNERLRMVMDPTLIIIASYGLIQQVKLIEDTIRRHKRREIFPDPI